MTLHRFRARALSLILRSQPSFPFTNAAPVVSLDRLLCSDAAAPPSVSSPPSFVAEDYLVSRCGLTRAKALKASKRISHFSSPSQPEAVLAFLNGTLGVPATDIAALVAMDPSVLCNDVERTVKPRIAELSSLGLSRVEIARLIPLAPACLRSRFLRRNIEFWLKELGSFDKLLRAVRMSSNLLCVDFDKVTTPNVVFLRQCGVTAPDIINVNIYSARLFTMSSERLRESVERVEKLGIKIGARLFPRALVLISVIGSEAVTSRIQFLQKFGFSQDDALQIVRTSPFVLGASSQKLQCNMNFLVKDVGLDLSYIVGRPALLMYSVERRLLPRHSLLKVLREKALLKAGMSYYTTASMPEKKFLQKFVLPYKDVVPGIVEAYLSKCSGKAGDRVALQEA